MKKLVYHMKTLDNGLRIVVSPHGRVPEVSAQLWYGVGSRHEGDREKGIAHFIEHMIFKGTSSLSESAIDHIVHSLSGYTNAFTSYDYTGYLFDLPSGHWERCLPILADCMVNCTFEQHCMNSEVKAVVQELKMYRDDYISSLIERMMSLLFYDHPYRHPIIGYKHDLLHLTRSNLIDFYQRSYGPQNAALIIVGDVQVDRAFEQAASAFSHINPGQPLVTELCTHEPDLANQSITLYRDIEQPVLLFAWRVPGTRARIDAQLDWATWIIGSGKGSLLYQKLVDELDIAQDVSCFVYDLFDYSVLFIQVTVYRLGDQYQIESCIYDALKNLAAGACSPDMVRRAARKTASDLIDLFQNNQKKAYILGKYTIALGDPEYVSSYEDLQESTYPAWLADFIREYLRPSFMVKGVVTSLDEQDRSVWAHLQELSDAHDQEIMSTLTRHEEVPSLVACDYALDKKPLAKIAVPEYQTYTMPNGLSVFVHHDASFDKTDILIDFQAKYFYDPEDRQGLMLVLFDMLNEGYAGKSAQELAQQVESRGMDLVTFPGMIALSALTQDVQEGLSILSGMVQQANLTQQALSRVIARVCIDIKDYWDNPTEFVGQLVRQEVYREHPYHKNMYGTLDTMGRLTQEDIQRAYKTYIVPRGTRVALVGNFEGINIPDLMHQYFGTWQEGDQVLDKVSFPPLAPIQAHEVKKIMNRDQVVLAFVGLSVARTHPDYDGLLLFDQVFTGGVLGSMGSRLFMLRQKTGLFYTIGGSLVASCDEQPGMLYIKTIVSVDALSYAQDLIREQIAHAVDTLTQTELDDARNAIVHALIQHMATPRKIASTLLFMDTFKLDTVFFAEREMQLNAWTVERVQEVVRRYLDLERLVTIKIGRV